MFDPRLACPAVSIPVIDLRLDTTRLAVFQCALLLAPQEQLPVGPHRCCLPGPLLVDQTKLSQWQQTEQRMSSMVLWLLYLGPRYFSALVPLLLPNTLNFRQVLSLRKLEGSFDVFCCSPSSSSILVSQSLNGTIALIPAPDNKLARPPRQPLINRQLSGYNTFCFLL